MQLFSSRRYRPANVQYVNSERFFVTQPRSSPAFREIRGHFRHPPLALTGLPGVCVGLVLGVPNFLTLRNPRFSTVWRQAIRPTMVISTVGTAFFGIARHKASLLVVAGPGMDGESG